MSPGRGDVPRVSVCMCTYNGVDWVERAIRSVLGQDYRDFELLIVDDASSDGTLAVVNGVRDERIRVVGNVRNLGNGANRSRAIRLARGEFLKFVDQDDWLEPRCLAEHVRLLEKSERVGLTFSRRAVAFENAAAARSWPREYDEPYAAFGKLSELNSGRALFERYLAAGLPANWIGEPTCVMLRRTSLQRCGLFSRRVRQALDMDLWIRVMGLYDVGFIEASMATRWIGADNETHRNRAQRTDWLDELWLLEGLTELPELWRRHPQLEVMRRNAQKGLVYALLTGTNRNHRLGASVTDVRAYVAHVLMRQRGRGRSVLDWLDTA